MPNRGGQKQMADVVYFGGTTTAPEPAESALEKAKRWELDSVIVVGLKEDGELVVGGNRSDTPLLLYMLAHAAKFLMENS